MFGSASMPHINCPYGDSSGLVDSYIIIFGNTNAASLQGGNYVKVLELLQSDISVDDTAMWLIKIRCVRGSFNVEISGSLVLRSEIFLAFRQGWNS